jgi:hypothetical protein
MSSIKRPTDLSSYVTNLNTLKPLTPGPITPSAPEGLQTGAKTAVKRPTVNLFDSSTYQAQAPVSLSDGSVLNLPSLSMEEAKEAKGLFANVPVEHHAAINSASDRLGQALMAQPNTIAQGSSKIASSAGATGITVSQTSPDVAGAVAHASHTYTVSQGSSYGSSNGTKNYDQTVQAVAYMGIIGLQTQLGDYATSMQMTLTNQNGLRTDQSELQTAINAWPADDTGTQNFTWHEVDSEGDYVTKSGDLTKQEAKSALSNVQSALSSYSDQTQLQTIQLQSMSQNYQTGINTISNLMKASYDTTKNTLGNIHY